MKKTTKNMNSKERKKLVSTLRTMYNNDVKFPASLIPYVQHEDFDNDCKKFQIYTIGNKD